MSKNLKGQNVNLFIDGAVVAASTSCTFALTANTADAAAKSDPGNGEWDNSEFTYYDWTASNESFIVDPAHLKTLMQKMVTGDAVVSVSFQLGEYEAPGLVTLNGNAILTQLQIQAPNGDFAKLSLSMEGCTPLTKGGSGMAHAIELYPRIKGKALMVALQDPENAYHTVAAATSHTLTLSVQTSDDSTKDDNDKGSHKEATGRSVSLSTENMLRLRVGTDALSGIFAEEMLEVAMSGETLHVAFGYYPGSMGRDAGADEDWGNADTVLLQGEFLCSSVNMTGTNKENATYTAEFNGKGMPTVS